jgi:hypothetical protein
MTIWIPKPEQEVTKDDLFPDSSSETRAAKLKRKLRAFFFGLAVIGSGTAAYLFLLWLTK